MSTCDTAAPAPGVAGVVDGSLTTVYDPDGNVCVRIVIGAGPSGEHHIEVVLQPEHLGVVRDWLLDGDRQRAASSRVPCSVGLRLLRDRPEPSDQTGRRCFG